MNPAADNVQRLAARLGLRPEQLAAIAAEVDVSIGDTPPAPSEPSREMYLRDVDAAAASCQLSREELLQLADEWHVDPFHAAEVHRDYIERIKGRSRVAVAVRPHKPRLSEAQQLEIATQRALEGQGTVAAAVAADHLLPPQMQGPAHHRPHFVSYRSFVVKRVGDAPYPALWSNKFGFVPFQVWAWLKSGRDSEDPVERVLTGAVRFALNVLVDQYTGPLERRKKRAKRRIFPIAAILHLIYMEGRKTKQPGYAAVLEGKPRGEIARLSGHHFCGQQLHPDTVSRYMAELGALLGGGVVSGGRLKFCLGGLIEWEQVPGSEALRHDLHKTKHILADGSCRVWATNIYRIRDAEWVARRGLDPRAFADAIKNRASDDPAPSPIESARVPISIDLPKEWSDLGQGYFALLKTSGVASSAALPGAVSPSPSAPSTSIRPPAAASLDPASARAGPAPPQGGAGKSGQGGREVTS